MKINSFLCYQGPLVGIETQVGLIFIGLDGKKYKELIETISKIAFQLDSKKPFHLLIPIPTHLGINELD